MFDWRRLHCWSSCTRSRVRFLAFKECPWDVKITWPRWSFSRGDESFPVWVLVRIWSRIPTPASLENIKLLVSVAKTELIAKPSISLSEIKIGMFAGRFKELWQDCRKEDVDDLFDNMNLTTSKVLQMIHLSNEVSLRKPQAEVLRFLKQYIRSLSPKELQCFVRYVTGSSLPVVKNIYITFHPHCGGFPFVYIHTCSAIIDLPDTGYTGFQDFRVQMDNTLKSPEAWHFTSA